MSNSSASVLQKTLPALVTAWQEAPQARGGPGQVQALPDDVVFVPNPVTAGGAPVVVPSPIVANNVVEYSGAPVGHGSASRAGNSSRASAQGQQVHSRFINNFSVTSPRLIVQPS